MPCGMRLLQSPCACPTAVGLLIVVVYIYIYILLRASASPLWHVTVPAYTCGAQAGAPGPPVLEGGLCSVPPAPGLYFSIPADNSSNRSIETFERGILRVRIVYLICIESTQENFVHESPRHTHAHRAINPKERCHASTSGARQIQAAVPSEMSFHTRWRY